MINFLSIMMIKLVITNKLSRDQRAGVPVLEDKVVLAAAESLVFVGPVVVAVVVTRSQRGHIVRVDAGSGSQVWGDITVGGPTFMALSSSTSLCSLRFCSVSDPNHLFRYSHSISVCFSLLLQIFARVTTTLP